MDERLRAASPMTRSPEKNVSLAHAGYATTHLVSSLAVDNAFHRVSSLRIRPDSWTGMARRGESFTAWAALDASCVQVSTMTSAAASRALTSSCTSLSRRGFCVDVSH